MTRSERLGSNPGDIRTFESGRLSWVASYALQGPLHLPIDVVDLSIVLFPKVKKVKEGIMVGAPLNDNLRGLTLGPVSDLVRNYGRVLKTELPDRIVDAGIEDSDEWLRISLAMASDRYPLIDFMHGKTAIGEEKSGIFVVGGISPETALNLVKSYVRKELTHLQ